jgi:putative ABC transport system ATP-binding protein
VSQGAALQVNDLRFGFAGQAHDLLAISQLTVPAGQSLGLRGASGAGKTTLFHCLAGITAPNAGRIVWGDADIAALKPEALARWRRANLGLVFQDFHLLDGLSALENVLLPSLFGHWRVSQNVRARAHQLLEAVGIHAPDRQAGLLSRGERQRVAFARAMVLQPGIVMADEPTASLDPEHRTQLGELLVTLTKQQGATLIVISHEQELLSRMNCCMTLQAGQLQESPVRYGETPA